MSRTTEIRRALQQAVRSTAPEARAFAAGRKYDEPFEGFALRVLIGDPEDDALIARVDEMLDDEGGQSIKAALLADTTLGGTVNNLIVARNSGHRLYPTPSGPVLGAEWVIEVL